MKCQNCEERQATFHKIINIDGEKSEMHLCPVCAAKQKETSFKSFNIGEFFLTGGGFFDDSNAKPITKKCSICQTKLSELVKTGVVGCSECYKVFEEEMAGVIAGAHGKGVLHLGKKPKKRGG